MGDRREIALDRITSILNRIDGVRFRLRRWPSVSFANTSRLNLPHGLPGEMVVGEDVIAVEEWPTIQEIVSAIAEFHESQREG